MTPEGKVKKQVKSVLDGNGVYYFMPSANGYGRVGIPDFICCVRGKFLAIECKAGGNTPTALQRREITAILNANGAAIVINETNMDLLHSTLTEMK